MAPFARQDIPARAGVGLKAEHLPAIFEEIETGAAVEAHWFEIHAENYMGAGGAPHADLARLRAEFPVSVHGVGLSIGAERGLDAAHLARFAEVVARYQPGLVSEHLAWSSHEVGYLNDLLPLPYTEETRDRVARHIDAVQEAIGGRMLLENPSTYVTFEETTISETAFLRQVSEMTGCGLLLDVNNVFVSTVNHGYSAERYLESFPLDRVGEIHLGGHAEDVDDMGARLLIDAHDRAVIDRVWALYESVVAEIGPRPTLVEWDNDVPEWPVLKAEAARANRILKAAERRRHAA